MTLFGPVGWGEVGHLLKESILGPSTERVTSKPLKPASVSKKVTASATVFASS